MTTYYKKEGGKYIPVMESEIWQNDARPFGFHMVHVQEGCTSWKYFVEPSIIEVVCATKIMKEAMIKEMIAKNTLHINEKQYPEHLKPKIQKAWTEWSKVMGENIPLRFEGISMSELVDVGLKELENHLWENRNK